MKDRFSRIEYDSKKDVIIASDMVGRVHILNKDLKIIKSSKTSSYNKKITGFCFDDKYIYTRNTLGAIGKWDIETLLPVDYHDDFSLRQNDWVEEEEEASLNNARGIDVYNGKVYTTNGYGQFIVLDAETFDCDIVNPGLTENSFVDCVNSENPEVHAISETCGMLHLGNLETNEFPIKVQVDSGNVHIVKYDKKNNRFIATQDYGLEVGVKRISENGLVTIELDGTGKTTYYFTADDVETIQFSLDYNYVFAAGFDGYIYVFENNPKLKLVNTIGPFHDQITYIAITDNDDLVVLLQSGEMQKINTQGKLLAEYDYPFSSIGEIESIPGKENNEFFLTTGSTIKLVKVSDKQFNSVGFDIIKNFNFTFGLITKVKPLSSYDFIALTRQKVVFRVNKDGELLWYKNLPDLPKSFAVNEELQRGLIGFDNGQLLEISIEDGSVIREKSYESPIYAVAYHEDNLLIGNKNGSLNVVDGDTFETTIQHELGSYPKRINVTNENIFIIGGTFGMAELDPEDYSIKKEFVELLINTKEDGVKIGDYVYVVSYGRQLGSFNYHTGELIHLDESLIDFALAVQGVKVEDGNDILIIAGHGGFVYLYRIVEGVPIKVREKYLV